MAMTVNDLQRYLDPKRIGSAPVLLKLAVLVVALTAIVAASWPMSVAGTNWNCASGSMKGASSPSCSVAPKKSPVIPRTRAQ